MRSRAIIAAMFLLGSASSALAAGPYLGVAGGVSIVHDGDITVSDVGKVTAEYDTGYGFNVTAGYNVEPIRLEFEFGYKNADLDKISGNGESVPVFDTEITVKSYMLNAIYDFKNTSVLTPYIGAGIGVINGEFKSQGDKEDDTEFGYQAIVGASAKVSENVALDLSYRFQSAPSDFSKEGTSVEYKSSNVMFGVRYQF